MRRTLGPDDTGSFSASIADFVGEVMAHSKDVCRKTFIELGTNIMEATPVDTGMTRNNWLPSTGSPDNGTREIADPTGATVKGETESVAAGWEPEKEDAYLTNNSIVAVVLEYGLYPNPPKHGTGKTINGFSTQAPAGMVRTTIARMKGG